MLYPLLVLLVLVPAPLTLAAGLTDVDFQDACTQRCPFQNKTEEGDYEVGCSNECKIEQCSRGCSSWQKALELSCPTVCNGTQDILPPKEMYCIMGCNDALNRYFQRLKEKIGTPPAPVLVADSLTATSLSLEWDGFKLSNISYLVQWRYEELAGSWQYCCNQSWGPNSTMRVENLQPYTKYRFRIALLLSPHHTEPLVSEPSVVISTLPSGTPQSAPTIVRATAVDSSHISVSWVPGPFPNGPILSYKLKIKELPEGYVALKDIPESENTAFYLVRNLMPSRNYSVSVTMRNSVGEGPAATAVVMTPAEPAVKDTLQPILILGAPHAVIRQTADMLHEPSILYNTPHTIEGVAIHVNKRKLFVSDSQGYILSVDLGYDSRSTILTPSHTNFKPLDLSIDWLNDQLYMLGQVNHSTGPMWQVARCGLDGRGLTIAMAGFLTRPLHIEVDPYNGYLFWVMQGSIRPGLYRLDLADISNGVKHEVLPDIILEDSNLGAFTVDHTNFRLLVANHTKNTVISVSLDGREVVDFRANTQQPMFHEVLSIATANGLFYWTNGKEVMMEEYNELRYFHNILPSLSDRFFTSVSVNLPTSQPMPIPVNPPISVQAIFGTELAKTSWQVPHLVGGQGKGAWQNWSYEVRVHDEQLGVTIYKRDINTTSYTIQNLKENTEYVIKAAAYTSSGIGPWSSEFRGKTLRTPINGKHASILWSSSEGLLKSDVTGENVETLIHKSNLKDSGGDYHITDIAWYEDKLYLVTNSTHVYWYNLTNHDRGLLHEIDSVGSIAVDWIGRKLYWSNPKQQLITRGNLNGSQQEPLILTVAKELNVDSIHAYIYWSTGHAVECARLNGADKRNYYPEEIFSGKQVMGLTLDMDRRSVYWIVRSYEGSKLFQAPMAEEFFPRQKEKAVQIYNLQHPNIQGPLSYFSDHLLWLQDDRNAVIGDLSGQNTALISKMSLSGLNMAAVVDPALHYRPNSSFFNEVNVIPESVNPASIKISGTWNSFIIEWDLVNNVNYDEVFYDVTVEDFNTREIQPVTTLDHYVVYEDPERLQPHSKLQVTINAYTYWGTSPQVRVLLHSPPSVPSSPTNPRVFVSYVRSPVKGDQDIQAAFRWDPPTHPNGVIEGYHVNCWYISPDQRQHSCESYHLDLKKLEYTANNLHRNSTYYFQVQAHTQVGHGNMTDLVRADTDVEMPVPKLLLSTVDAVKITDCDKHDNQTLSRSAGPPVDLAFMSHENRVFWLSEMKELLGSNLDGHNRTKILALNGSGLSITVDWVGRYIYWAESDEKIASSAVYRLDLNQVERGRVYATKVLHRPNVIYTLNMSPFRSTLFWIEVSANGLSYLMTSHTDGSAIQPFFSAGFMKRRRRESFMMDYCTCPENPPVGQAMTIDHTDPANPKLLWVDGWQNHVLSADANGCNCNLLVNASINADAGLPPTSLTTDQRLVYWSNATEGRVYSVAKSSEDKEMASLKKGVTSIDISGVQHIAALGTHLQPFPVARCLSPQRVVSKPQLVNRTSQSVTLELPHPKRLPECDNISLASVQYTVYYTLLQDDRTIVCGSLPDLCSRIVTYDHIVEIPNLKPYSNYVFYISLRNYYSEMEDIQEEIGPPSEFQTAAGAPSPPQKVQASVLSPNTVELRWLPPSEFNDETIHYEVHWRTEGMVSGLRHKGELLIEPAVSAHTEQRAELHKLLADQTYSIWVRACSHNSNTCSNSNQIVVTTYPEPSNVTVLSTTANSANISWSPSPNIDKFYIYCIETSTESVVTTVSSETYPNSTNIFPFYNLRPKKLYTVKLSILYPSSTQLYIWPSDDRFVFETQGDRPSAPGIPVVQRLRWDVYQVTWEQSVDNGAHLELYSLEARFAENQRQHRETNSTSEEDATSPNDMSSPEEWVIYFNGTDNYWIISELSPSMKYIFRVRSKNKFGWSEYSEISESFDFTEAAKLAEQQELGIVLGISIPIVVFILCIIGFLAFMYVFRRREKEKKALQVTLASVPRGPDVELATLRELPRRGNFIHNTNALYTTADIPTDEEMALLPHIRRDQITLTKFLGSGAFGEVFEGNAKNLAHSNGAVTRVAIKTLRKGATEQEKAEFLKEAQLMSNFKHEHILQLLGVCLDNDPNFIIMELMESGDLLSYLRSSRPHIYSSNALTLLDLLAMCVDVARGCRYLEEMHFVHRDLACRNCLVSSSDPHTRVVKIGDFGLARDIYKNDYYRKEGEGLLPVRWMAPESLVDGVFTCQSDVWAFGVLIWEIMTLGQQPYPARTNLEVLHYVRNGGRLGRPSNSPEELHQLMLKTWSYNPEHRPTFKYCLDVLEELKNKTTDIHLSAIQNGHYVSRTRNGSSWKTGSDEGSRDHIPFLQSSIETSASPLPPPPGILTESHNTSPSSTEPHRYLELIYDSDTATTVSDGYEIPRPLPATAATKSTLDRPRTFSTSSTISDGSASTSLSCQHAPSVCSTIDEVILPLEKTESALVISDIKSNGCIGGMKKNPGDIRRNGEKDLSTLEHLLPVVQNGQSNSEDKNSSITVPYSNVSKQSRLPGHAPDITEKQVYPTVS